jgi:hypothetical protein
MCEKIRLACAGRPFRDQSIRKLKLKMSVGSFLLQNERQTDETTCPIIIRNFSDPGKSIILSYDDIGMEILNGLLR